MLYSYPILMGSTSGTVTVTVLQSQVNVTYFSKGASIWNSFTSLTMARRLPVPYISPPQETFGAASDGASKIKQKFTSRTQFKTEQGTGQEAQPMIRH